MRKFLAGAATIALMLASVPLVAFSFNDTSGHWAEDFIDALVDEGVINGDNDNFRPDDAINRAELSQMVALAFLGGIDEEAFELLAEGDLLASDVRRSDWFAAAVATVMLYDVVNPTTPTTPFRPGASATRAEFLKMAVEGGQIESLQNPPNTFGDVSAPDWFYDYVTSAVNHCIIDGEKANFFPGRNITRAEAAKILYNTWQVSNGEELCEGDDDTTDDDPADDDMGDDDMGDDEGDDDMGDDEGDDDTDVIPVDGAVTVDVSISPESPESMTVPLGGTNVPFLLVELSAEGSEDAQIESLTISRSGLGDEQSIDRVKIIDGFEQKCSDRGFTSDDEIAFLNCLVNPVVIESGTTKTIMIAADIEDDNTFVSDEHKFMIDSLDDLVVVGAQTGGEGIVTGDFPVQGETMRLGSVQVGSLDFDFQTVADDELEVGVVEAEVCKIRISTGSEEDVLLQALQLEFEGLDDDEITNMYIEHQGERVTDIVDILDDEKALFDFTDLPDGGWLLQDGDTRTIRCRADVIGGVNEDLTVQFDEVESDVTAVGLRYGFGVDVTTNAPPAGATINIIGGDITLAVEGTSRDFATDTDDLSFGTFIASNYGEAVEVQQDFTMILRNSDQDGGLTDAEALNAFTDCKLVDLNTGATVFGPNSLEDTAPTNDTDDATGLNDVRVVFSDEIVIETNEVLVLDIICDVEPNPAAGLEEGDEVFWAFDMDTFRVEGIVSGDEDVGGTNNNGTFDITPTGDPTTRVYTNEEPTLTVSIQSESDDTYVAKADDVTMWSGTLRANSVEDLVLRSITFTTDAATTAEQGDIDNMSFYKVDNNVDTLLETGEDLEGPAGTPCGAACSVTFSSMNDGGFAGLVVPAGAEINVELRADIASTLSDDPSVQILFDIVATTSLDVEDEEGDAAVTVRSGEQLGATYTLTDSGELDVEFRANESPDSQILVADGSNVYYEVAAFRFEADNEDIAIDELTVDVQAAPDSLGTPVTTTLSALVAVGANEIILDSETGFADGDLVILSPGTANEEVVRIGTLSGDGTAETLTTVATAINQAAGVAAEATSFTVDSAAGILPGDQLLLDGGATNEIVTVQSVSGNVVTIRGELQNAFDDDDTVESGVSLLGHANGATVELATTFDCGEGVNLTCYADGINSVGLFYEDGTAVLKEGGQPAETGDTSSGRARIEDMDLIIPGDESTGTIIFVRTKLEAVDDDEPARSGMTFSVNLSFDEPNGESEIRGEESGDELFVGDGITVDGAGFDTLGGDPMYILRNNVIAELSSGQTTQLTSGTREALKFELTPSGGEETYLREVNVNLTQSGAGFGVCELRLKDGSRVLSSIVVADDGAKLSGDQSLVINTCGAGDTCNPSDPVNNRHVIDTGGDTFTIEAVIEGDADGSALVTDIEDCAATPANATFGDNDDLTLELDINGNEPGSDDITWQDYGTDGDDGSVVRWIDLGEDDESTTKIQNTLD